LALGTPVQLGVVDQAVDGAADRQVGLQDAAQQEVVLKAGLGEAAVALGRLATVVGRGRRGVLIGRSVVTPTGSGTTAPGSV
jgi:hypothetical protein